MAPDCVLSVPNELVHLNTRYSRGLSQVKAPYRLNDDRRLRSCASEIVKRASVSALRLSKG